MRTPGWDGGDAARRRGSALHYLYWLALRAVLARATGTGGRSRDPVADAERSWGTGGRLPPTSWPTPSALRRSSHDARGRSACDRAPRSLREEVRGSAPDNADLADLARVDRGAPGPHRWVGALARPAVGDRHRGPLARSRIRSAPRCWPRRDDGTKSPSSWRAAARSHSEASCAPSRSTSIAWRDEQRSPPATATWPRRARTRAQAFADLGAVWERARTELDVADVLTAAARRPKPVRCSTRRRPTSNARAPSSSSSGRARSGTALA